MKHKIKFICEDHREWEAEPNDPNPHACPICGKYGVKATEIASL